MNGKINFDHVVQRSYCWEKQRKSALIESMILGYPIPQVYAKRIDGDSAKRGDNTYYVMDGKQRLSTIKEYLNDEFELTKLNPITYFDDMDSEEKTLDISGMKFSELPESLRDYLNACTISVAYFNNLTFEEERELFKRLNAGKPLSAKNKSLASCKDIENLITIGEHPIFKEMLTAKARENKNQVTIIMKAWCMLNKRLDTISFEAKQFNDVLERTVLDEEDTNTINDLLDFAMNIHSKLKAKGYKKTAKKFYTETHFIALVPFIKKLMDNEFINADQFAEWVNNFYKTEDATSVSVDYNNACMSGNAKNVNIIARYEALEESYEGFNFVDDLPFK